MFLKHQLLENSYLELHNNVFYQKGIQKHRSFEESYIRLREKENRLHADDIVRKLPNVDPTHPNALEWQMRKSALQKLLRYLEKSNARAVLELGCGNGWLSYNLTSCLDVEVCAVDVNEVEVLQGARTFGEQERLNFVYCDILSTPFQLAKFDAIVLAASVQYFSDLKLLFDTLMNLLNVQGKIYIIDSPFYDSKKEAELARERSLNHFRLLETPDMAEKYFHHTYNDLGSFKFSIMYNPTSFPTLVQRKIMKKPLSIFPIICIKK
jgi:ubiquinone/menaquinone biosynthesis C-methylase UbiE